MIKPSKSVVDKWLGMVAEYGCVITRSPQVQLHHPLGRSYVIDKSKIGEIFVNPLHWNLHDVWSNDPLNVTHHRKAFVEEYGRECDLFAAMCQKIGDLPFEDFWVDLILKTNR